VVAYERFSGRRGDAGSHLAGIAQLARARAFQARGRGFESRFPLQASFRTGSREFPLASLQGFPTCGWQVRAWRAVCGVALACCLAGPVLAANPEAYRLNEAGVAEVRSGNLEAGIELFGRALKIDPQDEGIRKNLARTCTALGHRLLESGQVQRAEEQYGASVEADPTEVAGWLGLGEVQLRRRDPRAAIDTYRHAASMDQSSPDALIGLGQAYYNQGDLGAALTEWRRAERLRPEDAGLRQRINRAEREAGVQGGYRSRDSHHFRVLYEGRRQEDVGQRLVQILERAYDEVGYALGAYPDHEVQTILYPDVDFTAATGASTGIGGFYQPLDGKIRIAMRGLRPEDPELRSLLYHEYTHALIYAISRGNNPPRWVHEGLAVQLEGRRAPRFKEEAIRRARIGESDTLDGSPYVLGSVALGLLIERHGMDAVRTLLQRLGEGSPFQEAFQDTFRTGLASFEQAVRDFVTRGY
jgi:tetratricopeptide (TPR) repeat protein